MTKRFGFTLAEVLITLAIIGVVAAMTMPTLINNTNGVQFKTAYKKAMSVLSQAVVMNIALDDYDLSGTSEYTEGTDKSTTSLYAMFANRTNGSLLTDEESTNYEVYIEDSGNSVPSTGTNQDGNYVFRFQDGIIFSFEKNAANCTEEDPCYGWIDANGTKGPNKNAYCSDQNSDNECTTKVTINDIFPIKFYDQTVAPASAAAKAVLYGYENNSNGIEGNQDNS